MFWFVSIASLGTTGRKRGPEYDQYLCGKGTSLDHILFAVATTSRSFPAKLFPSWVAPSKYWCMRFFLPRCSPLKGLLNCRRFCQPISPACRGPSGWKLESLAYQPDKARQICSSSQFCVGILSSTILWSLQPRLPLTFTAPTSLSLLLSMRSSRASLLVGSIITHCILRLGVLHLFSEAGSVLEPLSQQGQLLQHLLGKLFHGVSPPYPGLSH